MQNYKYFINLNTCKKKLPYLFHSKVKQFDECVKDDKTR